MKSEKKRQVIIIGIIGIFTLVISAFFCFLMSKNPNSTKPWHLQFFYDAIFNIGFVLVGVFIANIVWSLVGGDPSDKFRDTLLNANTLLSDSVKSGIVGIYSSSSDMGSSKDWLDVIKDAKKVVYIQGYTLLVWTRSDAFDDTLIELAQKGVRIRLLFMDENGIYLDAGINDENIPELSDQVVKKEIITMTDYMDKVISDFNTKKGNGEGSIEYVKVKKNLITSQIVIADDSAYITPYMSFFNTPHCPMYKIHNNRSDLYKKYHQEFEKMWNVEKKNKTDVAKIQLQAGDCK